MGNGVVALAELRVMNSSRPPGTDHIVTCGELAASEPRSITPAFANS